MSPAYASSDNIGQIGYLIRAPQRREKRPPQAPFPKIEQEQEAEDEETDDTPTPGSPSRPPTRQIDRDGERHIDICVAGPSGMGGVDGVLRSGRQISWLRLPTGQFLPGPEIDSLIH